MYAGTPTLQQLLNALKKLKNWFVFGAVLGIPVTELKKIESSHQEDSDIRKLDMLQYWLHSKLNPTWDEVILALEQTDQLALATRIKHDYLCATSEEGIIMLALHVFLFIIIIFMRRWNQTRSRILLCSCKK